MIRVALLYRRLPVLWKPGGGGGALGLGWSSMYPDGLGPSTWKKIPSSLGSAGAGT